MRNDAGTPAPVTAPPRAIIVGASSGIGLELARVLAGQGYRLGLAARRVGLLEDLARSLPGPAAIVRPLDVTHAAAMDALTGLINDLGGLDLAVITAGTGHLNPALDWPPEHETLAVNVTGFAAAATVVFRHFEQAGKGHLVGISSIAALRGSRIAPAYNASKAFVSNYLEGLRMRARHAGLPIAVTDIQAGLVDTAMAKGEGLFWVAPPAKAAAQIWEAIRRRAPHAYVTRRWRLVAWALRLLPDFLYQRF